MPTKRNTKPLDGVSFAEFSRIIDRTKGYVSQMKSANRLVLTADGKRVLVEESKARIKATSDPAKWPLTLAHEAERRRKSENTEKKESIGLIPDPYANFLEDLFTDSRVEIVAGLMAHTGLSFETASLAFDEMVCSIFEVRNSQGFQETDSFIPNPRDSIMPEDWRAKVRAEIEDKARELSKLIAEEPTTCPI